jgi:hypothetical protein
MNITPTTRQITEYSLVLSSDDLARYLADPAQFAADVQAQLGGATPAAPVRKAGRRHPQRRPSPAKAPKGAQPAGGGLDKIKCSHCGKKIAKKFYNRHLLTKHSHPTKDSASSPERATAAAAT